MTQSATKLQYEGVRRTAEAREHEDFRCACGSLLARVVADGVELKCRRCKRTVVIPIDGGTTEIGLCVT